MMFGGSPSQGVWIMTCTSEISGRASTGIWRRDQIPVSTSKKVPVKTRNRLRAHQSIQRAIMLHPPFGIHVQLLAAEHLPVFLVHDRHLPAAPALKLCRTLVRASSLVVEVGEHAHRAHAHRRHGRHEEGDDYVGPGNGV